MRLFLVFMMAMVTSSLSLAVSQDDLRSVLVRHGVSQRNIVAILSYLENEPSIDQIFGGTRKRERTVNEIFGGVNIGALPYALKEYEVFP